MTIRIKDADDQNPVFTKESYSASVLESAKLTVSEEIWIEDLKSFDTKRGFSEWIGGKNNRKHISEHVSHV